jgi:DNA-binding beta-propeller fold protein YncE
VSDDGSGGACADGNALAGAQGVAVRSDGKNVYVASVWSSAVAVFARDKKTGVVTQLAGTDACVSADGSAGACEVGEGLLASAAGMALSPDGKNVYVASTSSGGGPGAVVVFARQTK